MKFTAIRKNKHLPYILLTLLFIACISKGIRRIDRINDYDVIRHGVAIGLSHSAELYKQPSRENRHYLYPPFSIFFLFPTSFFSYTTGNLLFLALRVVALILIYFICRKWLLDSNSTTEKHFIWIFLLAFIINGRFILNEFGNGQINILLHTLSICGIWLAMKSKNSQQFAGGFLIAVAASIKAVPILFFLPLLLHWRFKALLSGIVTFIVLIGLTYFWFGPKHFFPITF